VHSLTPCTAILAVRSRANVVPLRPKGDFDVGCEMTKATQSSERQMHRLPFSSLPEPDGLYDPRFEHDACGVSFVVDIKGRRSHDIVATALGALCNLEHRGAQGAEVNTGDGAGILLQVPDEFLRDMVDFDL